MIKDITPEQYRCSCSMSCPSVRISEDGKTLRITGKFMAAAITDDGDEATVELSADLVREALKAAGGSDA